jgi:hypothetical protein
MIFRYPTKKVPSMTGPFDFWISVLYLLRAPPPREPPEGRLDIDRFWFDRVLPRWRAE